MNLPKNLGILLLGIWLIVYGLIQVLALSFSGLGILMAIFAIVIGILLITAAIGWKSLMGQVLKYKKLSFQDLIPDVQESFSKYQFGHIKRWIAIG